MRKFLARPQVHKMLQPVGAYAVFLVAAALGLAIVISLHDNAVDLCSLFSVRYEIAYLVTAYGYFPLFIPYLVFIILLEESMHKASKTGQVMARARKLLLIEGGVGLVSVLVTLVFILTNRHISF